MQTRILVTGGAGFIASHIVDGYLKKGYSVSVIDNLRTGFRKNVHPKARFYKADITDPLQLIRIFKKERPQIVNHHAAVAEIAQSLRDPLPALTTNVMGTVHLLRVSGEYGVKRFIYASTGGAMYGEPKKLPVSEAAPAIPLSPYGLSKLMAEDAVHFYARHYGFDPVIFRYANVYGPRQNPKGEMGVIAIFAGLMKKGMSPTIFGDGHKARDYVYVSDIVSANVHALTKGTGETLNIGWGRLIEDDEVYGAVKKACRYAGDPVYMPHRKGEMLRISIDAAKARRLLGWKPVVPFEEGVRRAVRSV